MSFHIVYYAQDVAHQLGLHVLSLIGVIAGAAWKFQEYKGHRIVGDGKCTVLTIIDNLTCVVNSTIFDEGEGAVSCDILLSEVMSRHGK
jgi:hypothetical protein